MILKINKLLVVLNINILISSSEKKTYIDLKLKEIQEIQQKIIKINDNLEKENNKEKLNKMKIILEKKQENLCYLQIDLANEINEFSLQIFSGKKIEEKLTNFHKIKTNKIKEEIKNIQEEINGMEISIKYEENK